MSLEFRNSRRERNGLSSPIRGHGRARQGEGSIVQEFSKQPTTLRGAWAVVILAIIRCVISQVGICTAWNKSAILIPSPKEMRYRVSIEAEFLPSSI